MYKDGLISLKKNLKTSSLAFQRTRNVLSTLHGRERRVLQFLLSQGYRPRTYLEAGP